MKQTLFLPALLFSCVISLLSSCGQLSSLQTAEVLEKGETIIGGAVLGYGIQDPSPQGGELGSGLFPHIEILARRGIGSNLDMGLKLSTGANALLDAKYQLVKNTHRPFAVAIGGGLEFQWSDFQENVVFRAHVPVYVSYHFNEKNAIYGTGRYVFQSVTNDENSYFLGGSLGYQRRFSDRWTAVLEGSTYAPRMKDLTEKDIFLYQFGVGIAYHF